MIGCQHAVRHGPRSACRGLDRADPESRALIPHGATAPGVVANVDAIGPARTILLLERAKLPVPLAVRDAAKTGRPLFNEPQIDNARLFPIAA